MLVREKLSFMNKNLMHKLITAFIVVTAMSFLSSNIVYASCEENYGGGETCVLNKSFEIEKKVRKEGNSEWKDKVTSVDKGEIIEFRIRVKNVGEVETDNMKMTDNLPSSMERVGGDGLTEYFDNFAPGDREEFVIKAKVKDSEYDRKNFDKCVVNIAELEFGDKHEGSDDATVCYSDKKPTELPKTGAESTLPMGIAGTVLAGIGFLIKKSRK